MKEEKMLIEIEEKNIFKRIMNFIKRIFSGKQEVNLTNTEFYQKDNSFIRKMEQDRKILNMQKSFENGELKEEDLTQTEKNNLIKLYNEQIENLKKQKDEYNRTLSSYKEQILAIKSKLNN